MRCVGEHGVAPVAASLPVRVKRARRALSKYVILWLLESLRGERRGSSVELICLSGTPKLRVTAEG